MTRTSRLLVIYFNILMLELFEFGKVTMFEAWNPISIYDHVKKNYVPEDVTGGIDALYMTLIFKEFREMW